MGKTIVLCRDEADFSISLIFAGLVRRFGKENVIDYPPRSKNRQPHPSIRLIGEHEHDYGIERGALSYVDGCEDLKEYTRGEIMKLISDGGIDRIFTDEREITFQYYLEIIAGVKNDVPVVVVAGHDRFWNQSPDFVKEYYGDNFEAMFIDDWQPEYDLLPNTHLINLSCNFDHLWDVENREKYLADKKYDICFIGYNSNPVRKVVIDHVRQKWGHFNNCIIFEERPDTFDAFVRHDEMFRLIAQSKVCLNLPGASIGGRALRYYEIPYVGSCMLSMAFPAKLLHRFPCPQFSSLDELDFEIGQLLSDDELEFHAGAQHYHCMKWHTVDARMDYIFGVLGLVV